MCTPCRSVRADRHGVSLIELMVVLAIIAGVAALVAPRLPAVSASAELPLIKVLHAQLAAAVASGNPVHIILKDKELYSNSRNDVYITGAPQTAPPAAQNPQPAVQTPPAPSAKELSDNNPLGQVIYKLGPAETLQITEPAPSYYGENHPGVSFFPNGQMTRALWRYATGERRYQLRFSPFSARITVQPAS